MNRNSYFTQALQNFASDVAYVQSVRHLYNCGLSMNEIQEQCSYPVSRDKIQKVIEDYEREKKNKTDKKHAP